jgi:hypothetical protein
MTTKKRTWGQFATPIDLIDLLLGFCLRRSDDRLLDPSCGDGLLLRRAAQWRAGLAPVGGRDVPRTIYGVEMDPEHVVMAETVADATIVSANFFTLDADNYPSFDVVIGNPPYTRAEWIGRLDAAQPALFPAEDSDEPPARQALLPRELGQALSARSGLHAYFFLHSHAFLREGGRLGFIAPNGWLDVAYGRALKQFLLDHFCIVAVIESAVERWFHNAGVNTCAIILQKADDPAARAANHVRFVSLRQLLGELLGPEEIAGRQATASRLAARLLATAGRPDPAALVRARQQGKLAAGERWGPLLRAPEIALRRPAGHEAPLNRWATIHRGFTTGDNGFFYLSRQQAARWGIEPEFCRPLLKSLRGVRRLRVGAAECEHVALLIPEQARLEGTATAEYLAWGVARGVHRRASISSRRVWYALPPQSTGALLLAKGVWQRHFTALAAGPLVVDQQIYRLEPEAGVSPELAAALLNSAWFALQGEMRGRVNLGEGVLWLAIYELGELPLPDPRLLDATTRQALEAGFRALAGQPLADTAEALEQPARWALDELVFDLVGLPAAERSAAREALVNCLSGRRARARSARANGEGQ